MNEFPSFKSSNNSEIETKQNIHLYNIPMNESTKKDVTGDEMFLINDLEEQLINQADAKNQTSNLDIDTNKYFDKEDEKIAKIFKIYK